MTFLVQGSSHCYIESLSERQSKGTEMITVRQRRKLQHELANKFSAWMQMTDSQLRDEVQKFFPGIVVSIVTRDQCLKYLVMNHTEQMVGDLLSFSRKEA